jgi:predicted RecA/RadA family phage recombinase
MATNFVSEGDYVTVVAPFAAVRGRYIIVNATTKMGGVAIDNAASAANVVLKTRGVFTFDKVNAVSTSGLAGGYVYWDNTNSQVTISATSNTLIGTALAAFSNTATSVTVRLNGSF